MTLKSESETGYWCSLLILHGSFQLSDKEKVESGQVALGPDFHGGEFNRSHHVQGHIQRCFQ